MSKRKSAKQSHRAALCASVNQRDKSSAARRLRCFWGVRQWMSGLRERAIPNLRSRMAVLILAGCMARQQEELHEDVDPTLTVKPLDKEYHLDQLLGKA